MVRWGHSVSTRAKRKQRPPPPTPPAPNSNANGNINGDLALHTQLSEPGYFTLRAHLSCAQNAKDYLLERFRNKDYESNKWGSGMYVMCFLVLNPRVHAVLKRISRRNSRRLLRRDVHLKLVFSEIIQNGLSRNSHSLYTVSHYVHIQLYITNFK